MCSSSEGNEEIQLKCTRSQWYEMEHFHWNAAGETIPYSGNPNEDDQQGWVLFCQGWLQIDGVVFAHCAVVLLKCSDTLAVNATLKIRG